MADLFSCPKTAFLPAGMDACGMYRMFMPHMHIPGSTFIFRQDRLPTGLIKDYEVIVVQRQATPQNYNAMKTLRRLGKKVIYDLDDNMWAVPASNPGARLIRMMRDGFALCAKEASLITVSTQGLKTAVQAEMPYIGIEILVTPNGVDMDWMQPTCLQREDGKVIVGWGGSNTHAEDIRDAWSVLGDILSKHENLGMEFIGELPPAGLERHPRVRIKNWVPIGEFANRFSGWSWDISLAPLVDNRFNRSKSCIKALEAATMSIPCLMSDVQPYREFVSLGDKELMWLLCQNRRQWKDKLSALIEDQGLRKRLGQLMNDVTRKWFSMDVTKENWMHAIRQAAKC